MQILDYKHIAPSEKREGYFAIPELVRNTSSVNQFIKLSQLDIELTKPTGFIYVEGFAISQAESGVTNKVTGKYTVAVCSGTSFIMHKWLSTFKNKHFIRAATNTTGTCASGMQALHIAREWMETGVCEEVILIGGERITEDTIRLFKELRIGILCGDGFVYMKLGRGGVDIEHTKWRYAYNANAFSFTAETLNNLIPWYPVNYVKLHATGSPSNDAAEEDLAKLGIPITYKQNIGHTQGISSLLELCIVMADDSIRGSILVVANGVGGFYGSCTINK